MLDRPVIWGQQEPKRELTGFSSRGPAVSPSALTAPSPQIHTTRPPSTLYILHMFSWTGLARPPGTQCRCSPLPGRSPLLWTLEVFLCRSSPRGLSLQTKGGGTVTCTSKYLASLLSPAGPAKSPINPTLPPTELGGGLRLQADTKQKPLSICSGSRGQKKAPLSVVV